MRQVATSYCRGPLKKPFAFTFIELVVVIFILIILITLISMSIVKARAYALNTYCINNLRNLHISVMNHLYAYLALPAARSYESYDEYSPLKWYEGGGWVVWRDWQWHPDTGGDWSGRRPGKPDLWWGTIGTTCITNGSLWRYCGKNIKTYVCPVFFNICAKKTSAPDGSLLGKTNPPLRSYVMNSFAGGRGFGNLVDASKILLFAEQHSGSNDLLISRDGSEFVRVCRQGFFDNLPPAPNSYYVTISDSQTGYVEPCSYDCELTGLPDETSGGAYPIESIGTFHGSMIINGKEHPYGYGVFIDGHIEQLTWWQTTNACAGNF